MNVTIDGGRIELPIRLPVELEPPAGFRPDEPATWPGVEGRLEYVDGRLLYLPPCGGTQSVVVTGVASVLIPWADTRPGFVVGLSEPGMLLAGGVRAADAAVWRRIDVPHETSGFRRVPPLLAAEVAGQDEDEGVLRAKAEWYFGHGVRVVWLILPAAREVFVLTPGEERRLDGADRLPAHPDLPDLAPDVARFFAYLR